jgi:catalase (peroxidase I)
MTAGIPGFVRAAFHDAGTYNRAAGTGGANGSLLTSAESRNMRAHAGIVPTLNALKRFRTDINARLQADGLQVSAADLIQLAGAYAVELAGGPSLYASIPVGRVDTDVADSANQLPFEDNSYNTIACKFVTNGYSITEMYALTGAHTLGVVRRNGARVDLDPTPNTFDVAYWQQLQQGGGVLRSDRVINTANPSIIGNYIDNQDAFYTDFVNAFVKMGKQGATFRSYQA